MNRIAVFLVDDHSVLRQGLRLLIDEQPDMSVVGEAERARGAAEAAVDARADVVVVDVSMPDASGRFVVETLRAIAPAMKIVALTRHTERAYVQQMMGAGAQGYVLKQTPVEVLLGAIRAVAGGGSFVDPAIAERAAARSDSVRVLPPPQGALTQREIEVASMVALGHTNKEIATALGITVKTVETHKANLMRKLEITTRAELVRFALMRGWME